MIFSSVPILALLLSVALGAPGGYGGHGEVVITGPSGVVTNNGPVGPAGFGSGGFGPGGFAPAGFGFGGHGAFPGAGLGYGGFGGHAGYGGHGIVVNGPPTVPATIIGPAGKIVAGGLYGIPGHGHGAW